MNYFVVPDVSGGTGDTRSRCHFGKPEARGRVPHRAWMMLGDDLLSQPSAPKAAALTADDLRSLSRHCLSYRDAIDARAWTQLCVTLSLYLAICATLLAAISSGVWWAIVLALPAGMLLVRIFTFQHDCGHRSFFRARGLNDAVGRALSVVTFTPYGFWRRTHAQHHTGAGNLDRRGIGDIDTYTVREYEALSPAARRWYRIYRHPVFLHVIGPPIYFLGLQRSPWGQPLSVSESWRSIMGLNLALVVLYGGLASILGWGTTAIALLPVACVAAWVGSWLFFVQHQFEHTYWAQAEDWHTQTAALHGSSHYILPGWLNWLTGDIALHHIHHLNSHVPGYRLRDCLRADDRLAGLSRLTVRESIGCIGLSLWDEDAARLTSFREAARV